MEILITLIVLTIIFSIGFLVGNKQLLKKENGYEQRWDDPTFPNKTLPTSSLNEVPAELLMGGDIERALHIAGIKEAPIEKQIEWQNKRKAEIDEKVELNTERLRNYIETKNEEMQIKAGIKQHDQQMGVEDLAKVMKVNKEINKISLADLATPKYYNPIEDLKKKNDAARKEADRAKTEYVKRNFEALPLSRLSVEGMNKIIEFVREDIQNQVKKIEKNTPISVKNLMNPETVHTALASITIVKPKRKYTKKTK